MTNNNTQTVTISVARYKQLEGLLEKARGRAWTYEQANAVLAARVAELEAELSARLSVIESAALKARIAELEEDNDALERRLGDVQADRDEWRHCNAMLQDENAALKARIAELEAKNDTIKDDYFKLHDYALELEDRETHLENLLKYARDEVTELEAEQK